MTSRLTAAPRATADGLHADQAAAELTISHAIFPGTAANSPATSGKRRLGIGLGDRHRDR